MTAAKTLAGATVLAFVLGSLHSYSVLLEPIEARLDASRTAVSLIYSLATILLVTGVFMTAQLLKKMSPAGLAALSCGACAAGLILASVGGLATLYVGFGIVFGFANGLGYALSIERSGAAYPAHKGKAIGLVTAAYCAGAIAFSKVFSVYAVPETYHHGLLVLAATIACAGVIVALLLRGGPAVTGSDAGAQRRIDIEPRDVGVLWSVYFLGVTAGLMALGHAAAVVSAVGGEAGQVAAGAMVVSFGSASGSLACGWLTDRMRARAVLTGSLVLVGASMAILIVASSPIAAIAGLGVAGLAYGALITVIPVVVARGFAPEVSLKAFGRVFTAWGAAGLAGPWLGGAIFDLNQSYVWAFVVAACAAAAAVFLSLFSLKTSQAR